MSGQGKGAIRGINWGCLEFNVIYLEKALAGFLSGIIR